MRSVGSGQGSEFLVRLPILLEPVREPQAPRGESMPQADKLRVVIVDDYQEAAKLLSMVVKLQDHKVRAVHDGLEAIDVAAEFQPNLVLMDLGIPKMNGYEAARRIREQPWSQDIMLVALTGWGQEEDKRCTREAGCERHLVKPVEPTTLRELLTAHPANLA